MTSELDLSRQSILVPQDNLKTWKIEIFGIGSIGSHVAFLLAKTGFKNIKVYDNDVVDTPNISPQAYFNKHVGMNKVDAMKDLINESVGIEIETEHGLITDKSEIEPEPNTIYCCFFDHFEGRQTVLNKIKEFPTVFVDGRIGKYYMQHYLVECSKEADLEKFEKSLNTGKESTLACGEKASSFINYTLAGLIVSNIIAFMLEKKYTKSYMGHALDHTTDIEIKKD